MFWNSYVQKVAYSEQINHIPTLNKLRRIRSGGTHLDQELYPDRLKV